MTRYLNKNGNSGVLMYEIHKDYMDVMFNNNTVYRYSNIIPGQHELDMMKSLAICGSGLCRYISKNVGRNYARKL